MRARTFVAAIVATAFTGGDVLYAQPGSQPSDPPGPGSAAPAPAPSDEPDLSLPTEKNANLSPREMDENGRRMIDEMEAGHRRTLELKAAAQKAKDVIKLNCVNEQLLAVKQLLNIADQAKNDFTEAKAQDDRGEQVHQYGQITIAAEKSKEALGEAQACIGEELYFIGKNDVTVDGPAIPHDPTADGDVGNASGEDAYTQSLEDPAYASPFAPPL